jgi:hypothetical protein
VPYTPGSFDAWFGLVARAWCSDCRKLRVVRAEPPTRYEDNVERGHIVCTKCESIIATLSVAP